MLKTASSKINLVAAVLALAAVILAYVTHAYSEANALLTIGQVVAAGVGAVVLCILPVVLKNDIVNLVAALGAIACNMFVVNGIVLDRILMIAGIFSYNSQDQVGWTVFYIIIAASVCAVLSCVATMVSSFMKK